jgi:tetratricopeptide (TPR) repeat protein
MSKVIYLREVLNYEQKAKTYFDQALLDMTNQDYKESISKLMQCIHIDENNQEYYYYIGLCFYIMERYEESLGWLDKALVIAYSDDPLSLKGIVLYHLKKTEEALSILLQVVESKEIVHSYIGKCYSRLDRYEEAILHFGEANQLQEKEIHLYQIGFCYSHLFHYELAESFFEKSICLNDSYFHAYYQLANVYLKQRKHDKAILLLEKLKEKFPEEKKLVDSHIAVIFMLKEIE